MAMITSCKEALEVADVQVLGYCLYICNYRYICIHQLCVCVCLCVCLCVGVWLRFACFFVSFSFHVSHVRWHTDPKAVNFLWASLEGNGGCIRPADSGLLHWVPPMR